MDDCMGAVASEDIDSTEQNIAVAMPLRRPERIGKSRKVEIGKRVERDAVERWSRTEALKIHSRRRAAT